MQLIEYGHYDIASNETETKDLILGACKYDPILISVLPSYVKLAKSIIGSTIKCGAVVDYPLGLLDNKSRLSSVEFCLKSGASVIELVAPSYLLCNRKYEKFRDDIKSNLELCQQYGAELRYIIEYRVFTLELMYKIAQILVGYGINTIYPSTGYSLDDINDNLLARAMINKKIPEINIIANGNIWNDKQVEMIFKNIDLYGFKCHSINSLERLHYYKNSHSK